MNVTVIDERHISRERDFAFHVIVTIMETAVRTYCRKSITDKHTRMSLARFLARRAYSSVAAADIDHFRTILPPHAILSTISPSTAAPAELDQYNNDWMGKYRGRATTVLKPKTTQQVSDIVRWCASRDIPIVPQGGNTGLVGGSVPLRDELVVSLASMNSVRSFDPVSGAPSSQFCGRQQRQFYSRHSGRRRWMYPAVSHRLRRAS